MQARSPNSCISSSSLPDSIFEKSRTSPSTLSSASPLVRMTSAHSRCSGLSGESSRRPVMPMTPFIGVRISWLIAARNSDLARDASWAASWAASARWRASSSARTSSTMASD